VFKYFDFAIAYFILTRALIFHNGRDSTLAIAVGEDFKGKVSMLFYAVAIPLAFVNSWFACALDIGVKTNCFDVALLRLYKGFR
jgi:hypothetical protein